MPSEMFLVPFAVGCSAMKAILPIYEEVEYDIDIALRPHQQTDILRIVESINTTGSSYFIAQCGYGKTIMFFYLMSILKQRTIIVLPNLTLVKQTYDALIALVNDDFRPRVQILGTDRVINDETDVLICYIGRLDTKKKSSGERDGPIHDIEDFKYVILDEVHLLTSPTHITGLMSLRPSRISAFTATRGERDNLTTMFVGSNVIYASLVKRWKICFPRIITSVDKSKVRELTDATIDRYLSKRSSATSSNHRNNPDDFDDDDYAEEMRANGLDDNDDDTASDTSGKVSGKFKAMIEYGHTLTVLSSNDIMKQFVIKVVNHFKSEEKRVMIVTVRIDMTEALYQALHEDSNEGERYVVEYLDRNRRECGNCDVLIGTHKKLGTGFDERNSIVDFEGEVASVLLFLGSIKDKTLMYQVAGRVFRSDNPLVIFPLMVDLSFSHNHINSIRETISSEMKECDVCDASTRLIEQLT
jgi:superfamily II DNA or RNA helicase